MTDDEIAALSAGHAPAADEPPPAFLTKHPHTYADDVKELEAARAANAARSPLRDAADTVNRAGNSLIDRASFGAYGGGLRMLGHAIGNPELEHGVDQYRQEHPIASQLTDAPAYFVGPQRALAEGIDGALPAAGNLLTKAIRASLGSSADAAVNAGLESASKGHGVAEVGSDTGHAALTAALMGGGLGGAGALMGSAGRKVLGSRGADARRFIEERGGKVGVMTPGSGGPLEGAPSHVTDADLGEQATLSAEAVKSGLADYRKTVATDPYVEAIGKVAPDQAGHMTEISPIYQHLVEALHDPANLPVADKLERLAKMLEQRQTTLPGGSKAIFMTEEQLNGLRRALADISDVGDSTAGKNAPLRQAFGIAKGMVDQGPYAEANRKFAEGADSANESARMLGLRYSTNPNEPVQGNLTVRAGRAGQNTRTAGQDKPGLDAFREKHPELALELDKPELLRSKADLSFHALPNKHGGLIERVAGPLGGVAGAVVASGQHSPASVIASILGGLAVQNATPLAGRVLYRPAQSAVQMESALRPNIPSLANALRGGNQ